MGTGSGLSYAGLGATHHSMEDIAALRMLPNMQVIAPSDSVEVKLALQQAVKQRRPTYIRIGKKGEPILHKTDPEFSIGRGIVMRSGDTVAILGSELCSAETLLLGESLERDGISCEVISLHTIKPLDDTLLERLFSSYERIVVIEEHGLAAGAGSAILEWGSDHMVDVRKIVRFGGPDRFLTGVGGQQNARDALGLNANHMAKKVIQTLDQKC